MWGENYLLKIGSELSNRMYYDHREMMYFRNEQENISPIRHLFLRRISKDRMVNNPAAAGLGLIVALMSVGAIGLAIGGFDPTIAVDIGLPIFLLAVFVAIGFGFFNAAMR